MACPPSYAGSRCKAHDTRQLVMTPMHTINTLANVTEVNLHTTLHGDRCNLLHKLVGKEWKSITHLYTGSSHLSQVFVHEYNKRIHHSA